MKRFFSVVGAFIIATGMSCAMFIGVSYADALEDLDETENSEVEPSEQGSAPELTYVGEEYYEQTGDVDFYQLIQAIDEEDGEMTLSAENAKCRLEATDEEVTEDGYQSYALSCIVTDSDGNESELTHTLYIKAELGEGGDTEPTPDEGDEGDGEDSADGDDSGDEGDAGGNGDNDQGDGDQGNEDNEGNGDEGGDNQSGDSGDSGDNTGDDQGSGDNSGDGNDAPGSDNNNSGDNSDDSNNSDDSGDNGNNNGSDNSDDNQGNHDNQDTDEPGNSDDSQGDQNGDDNQGNNDNQDTPVTPGSTTPDQPDNSGNGNSDGDLPIMLPTTGGDSIFNRIPRPLLYSLFFGFVVASIVYCRTDRATVSRKSTH